MAIPEHIGKYAISEVLGRGAMGVVYKGFDPHIHRPVAIKVIHRELLGDPDAHEAIAARFRNEAQAVGRVAHPGVVGIYEFGEDADTAYIAMEFVPGRNLDQVLAGTPLLDEAQLLRIMDQLLDALGAAHAQGVWHRDIKPANLILTATGQVKLTDFGIARIEHAGLTQVASTIGTPGYMAPEQYTGEGIDHRADVFACGVLLHRLLTGQPAFAGSADVIMYRILHEQPAAPSTLGALRRPAAYDAVVARALAKSPADRFGSAQAMRQALLDIAGATASPASSVSATNSDATVIVPPELWARAMADAKAAPALSTATESAHAPPSQWDAQTLGRIERALATHIGPMARLRVRQAATASRDLVDLANAVSVHIPEAGLRQGFLDAALAGSGITRVDGVAAVTGVGTAAAPTATGTAATPVAAMPLDDAFRTQSLQMLTRRLGPIARLLVRRADERCAGDRARFVDLLVDGVEDKDRAALRRDLERLTPAAKP